MNMTIGSPAAPKLSVDMLINQAIQSGQLSPAIELEIHTLCDSAHELSLEDYMALDRLRQALQTNKIQMMPRKQFINVMETIVMEEALRQLAQSGPPQLEGLDLGDIIAYALNRLPALYATTQEGAHYQKIKAKKEFGEQVTETVQGAIAHSRQLCQNQEPLNSDVAPPDLTVKITGLLNQPKA